MSILTMEQRIPGDLIYGNAHAVSTALSRPLRCDTDPRWHWPEPCAPLPSEQEREQHFQVWLRGVTTMEGARG